MARCNHYWEYPQGVIAGPSDNWGQPKNEKEVYVVRRCLTCGRREMANTSNWREAKGDYKRDEHYELPAETPHASTR